MEMCYEAILNALSDAGLTVKDLDGFAQYAGGDDAALIAQSLGVPEVRYSAIVSGGGGGASGAFGLAASAIVSGYANVVVCFKAVQQSEGSRIGQGRGYGSAGGNSMDDFIMPSGLVSPPQRLATIAQRHMYLYGTKREHFAEVVITQRNNASRRTISLMRTPITLEDYFNARIIATPFCLFDCCLENDGAVACVITSAERARDLKQRPVYIMAAAMGGNGRWGQELSWLQMPNEYFASSGHRPVARDLYAMAGVGPQDIDVAELYDHFSPYVFIQLEDYGFCPIGEGGPFVADGNIRWPSGRIPVNTHGGNLSDSYLMGTTHMVEAVEQLRGTAINQVKDAEIALVTSGPGVIPNSSLILRR
jgi:acetyl-CoA acetyltransferase